MKMTPREIIAAYKAIHELSGTVLPYRAARGVAALKKRLTEEFETVAAMEKNLVERYGGTTVRGRCRFPDAEAEEQFQEEHEVVMEQEDEIQLPVVDLSPYTDLLRLSPSAVEALEGVVIFDRKEGADG